MEGVIFDIKRMALHDGPGIRQTVFLKGCPLHCLWCHNPESRSMEIVLVETEEKIGGELVKKKQTIGKRISDQDLLTEILRDRLIYEESHGGVTFSGGEPMMQAEFLLHMLQLCRKNEIHSCVDTTGHTPSENLLKIHPFTDLFLYDLKHPNSEIHRKYTGVGNEIILHNLQLLDDLGADIRIRIPLIPTVNDSESTLHASLQILLELKHRYPVDILPYHKIGQHKYARFGLPSHLPPVEEPSAESINRAKFIFEKHGYKVTIGG